MKKVVVRRQLKMAENRDTRVISLTFRDLRVLSSVIYCHTNTLQKSPAFAGLRRAARSHQRAWVVLVPQQQLQPLAVDHLHSEAASG